MQIRRRNGLFVVAIATWCTATTGFGQPAESSPSFEVASVRATPPRADSSTSLQLTAGSIRYTDVTLRRLLTKAFDMHDFQISGPKWIGEERYDLIAQWPKTLPPSALPLMLRRLLQERFGLQFHLEAKDTTGFDLTVTDANRAPRAKEESECEVWVSSRASRLYCKSTLAGLAKALAGVLGRPVWTSSTETELFDVALRWSSHAESDAPSIFAALQEQLGLRVKGRRGTADYLIVDVLQRIPTEN
jgi:uncharacterized protein (TIGR03435 family)